MPNVVNIFPEPVEITIAGSPGSKPKVHKVKPRGKVDLPESYVDPVPSAGRKMLPSIVARMTARTWPDGRRRPALVPEEAVEETVTALQAAGVPTAFDAAKGKGGSSKS